MTRKNTIFAKSRQAIQPINRVKMDLRFLTAAALSAILLPDSLAARRPNFVIILADDMGYGDLRPYGNTLIETPNLDRMAERGMLFTDFHSNGAVSTPTRCALLTGRYQQRAGLEGVILVSGPMKNIRGGLMPDEVTFAKVLSDNGYNTALFGKWHLGYQPATGPGNFGFRNFNGFKSGNVDYHSHRNRSGEPDWWHDAELKNIEGYTTSLLGDLSCRFIRDNRNDPFCLYIAHGAPHSPLQGPGDPAVRDGESREKAPRRAKETIYKDMIEELDKSVGRVLQCLCDCGLEENTLVVFFSDNGPVTGNGGSAGGLRGEKGSPWEGGHREPAIFHMPGSIEPGTVCDVTAMGFDLFPTMMQMASIEYNDRAKPLDGVSIAPLLQGRGIESRTLFWGTGDNNFAVRDGDWKLVRTGDESMLFDLASDRNEQRDLAARNPGKSEELNKKLEKWKKSVYGEVPDQLKK
jgi:arylsulfatase A-like enzyme